MIMKPWKVSERFLVLLLWEVQIAIMSVGTFQDINKS